MVAGIARRLTPSQRAKTFKDAVSIYDGLSVLTISYGLSKRLPGRRNNIIVKHLTPPKMPGGISDVRGFQHRVFRDLARDRHVPLNGIGRAEVRVHRVKLRVCSHAGKIPLEPGIDAI